MSLLSAFYQPLKRFYKFILKRVIGNFLENELDLNQLDVQLGEGVVELRDLTLKAAALNELLEGSPFRIVAAYVRKVTVTIPWKALLKERCRLQIEDIEFVIVPVTKETDERLRRQQERNKKDNGGVHRSVLDVGLHDMGEDGIDLTESITLHRKLQEEEDVTLSRSFSASRSQADAKEYDGAQSHPSTDEGLEVVAGLIEHIVSHVQLEINDVSLRIQHENPKTQTRTSLLIRIPWLMYSDIGDNPSSSNPSSSSSSASAPSSSSPSSSMGGGPTGLKYVYNKVIRFHGFRVEISQDEFAPDDEQDGNNSNLTQSYYLDSSFAHSRADTIIHGDKDQDCVVNLKVHVVTGQIELGLFIRSWRMLVKPKHLAMLVTLFAAVMEASAHVAGKHQRKIDRAAAKKRERQERKKRQQGVHLPSSSSSSPAAPPQAERLTPADYAVIEQLLNDKSDPPDSKQDVFVDDDGVEFFRMKSDAPAASMAASSSPARVDDEGDGQASAGPVELWSIQAQLLLCSVTIMQYDEAPWPEDWWIAPVSSEKLSEFLRAPREVNTSSDPIDAHISGVADDHLLFVLGNCRLTMKQTNALAKMNLWIRTVTLQEFLLCVSRADNGDVLRHHEHKFVKHNVLGVRAESAPPVDQKSMEVKEESEEEEGEVKNPNFKCSFTSSMQSGVFLEPYSSHHCIAGAEASGHVAQRVILAFDSVDVDLDVGIANRCCDIITSISDPEMFLAIKKNSSSGNAGEGTPLPDSPVSSEQKDVGNDAALAAAADAGISQVIVTVPDVRLRLHAARQRSDEGHAIPPWTDSRGAMHEEHILLELHDIVLAQGVKELYPSFDGEQRRAVQLNHYHPLDVVWLCRFESLEAALVYRSPLPGLGTITQHVLKVAADTRSQHSEKSSWLLHPLVEFVMRSAGTLSHRQSDGGAVGEAEQEFKPMGHVPQNPRSRANTRPSHPYSYIRRLFEAMKNGPSAFRVFERSFVSPSSFSASQGGYDDGAEQQKPTAEQFESNAEMSSWFYLTLSFPMCEVHLTQFEYLLLLRLQDLILQEAAKIATYERVRHDDDNDDNNHVLLREEKQFSPSSSLVASSVASPSPVAANSVDPSMFHSVMIEEADLLSSQADINPAMFQSVIELPDNAANSELFHSVNDFGEEQKQQGSVVPVPDEDLNALFEPNGQISRCVVDELTDSEDDEAFGLGDGGGVHESTPAHMFATALAPLDAFADAAAAAMRMRQQPSAAMAVNEDKNADSIDLGLPVHRTVRVFAGNAAIGLRPLQRDTLPVPETASAVAAAAKAAEVKRAARAAAHEDSSVHLLSMRVLVHSLNLGLSESISSLEDFATTLARDCKKLNALLDAAVHAAGEEDDEEEGARDMGRYFEDIEKVVLRKQTLLDRVQTALLAHPSVVRGSSSASTSAPQTFFVQLREMLVSLTAGVGMGELTYISVTAGDVTAKALREVVTDLECLPLTESVPLLYRRLNKQKDTGVSDNNSNNDSNVADQFKWMRQAVDSFWRDPLLKVYVLLETYQNMNTATRDVSALVDARWLTVQFEVEHLECFNKMLGFFTGPDVAAAGAGVDTGAPQATDAKSVAVNPVVQMDFRDVVRLSLHAYDCAVDYNPNKLESRVILSLDHVEMTTETDSKKPEDMLVSLELWNGASYLLDKSDKGGYACLPSFRSDFAALPEVCFHGVSGDITKHMKALGFVRIMTFPFLYVKLNLGLTKTGVRITNNPRKFSSDYGRSGVDGRKRDDSEGIVFYTCWDSFQIFSALASHLSAELTLAVAVQEVNVTALDGTALDQQNLKQNVADAATQEQFIVSNNEADVHLEQQQQQAVGDAAVLPTPEIKVIPNYGDAKAFKRRIPKGHSQSAKLPQRVMKLKHRKATGKRRTGHARIEVPDQSSRWYDGVDSVELMHDYVSIPDQSLSHRIITMEELEPPEGFPDSTTLEVVLWDTNVSWRLFDGNDFDGESKLSSSSSSSSSSVKAAHTYASAAPSGSTKRRGRADSKARGGRRTDRVLDVSVSGLHVHMSLYGLHEKIASRLRLCVEHLHVYDHIVSSPFRTLLQYHASDRRGRELHTAMVDIVMVSVRPDPVQSPLREELRIKLSVLPIRLFVDQEAVVFLLDFFLTNPTGVTLKDLIMKAKQPAPAPAFPAPTAAEIGSPSEEKSSSNSSTSEVRRMSTHPAYATLSSSSSSPPQPSESKESNDTVTATVYIQSFECPMLWFCVDYKPNSVDFRELQSGDYSQLLHMFPLEKMDMLLKPVQITGAAGWDGLAGVLGSAWAKDLADHQVNRYLAGVQPIRSLVNIGNASADLLIVPYTRYRKDGRLLRGLAKGAGNFVKAVAVEAMNIGGKFAQVTQTVLEAADDVFSGKHRDDVKRRTKRRRQQQIRNLRGRSSFSDYKSLRDSSGEHDDDYQGGSHQTMSDEEEYNDHVQQHSLSSIHGRRSTEPPKSAQEGMQQAYQSLARGLQTAMHGMVVVPAEDYRRYGVGSAVKSVVSAVPSMLIRPMIGASEAVNRAMIGAKNSIEKP